MAFCFVVGKQVHWAFQNTVRKPELLCTYENIPGHEDSSVFRSNPSFFEKAFFRLNVAVSSLISLNDYEVNPVVFRGISV